MKNIAIITTVLFTSAITLSADTAEEKRNRFRQEFRHVPLPELPARAAEMIRKTPARERSQAAVIAVETIAERHPAAARTVAAAISKAAPETRAAAVAAATRHKEEGTSRGGKNKGESGNEEGGPGKGNGHANGGVGHGVNKPGKPIHPHPVKDTLPNGKPRHFPKEKPQHYNKPKNH